MQSAIRPLSRGPAPIDNRRPFDELRDERLAASGRVEELAGLERRLTELEQIEFQQCLADVLRLDAEIKAGYGVKQKGK